MMIPVLPKQVDTIPSESEAYEGDLVQLPDGSCHWFCQGSWLLVNPRPGLMEWEVGKAIVRRTWRERLRSEFFMAYRFEPMFARFIDGNLEARTRESWREIDALEALRVASGPIDSPL